MEVSKPHAEDTDKSEEVESMNMAGGNVSEQHCDERGRISVVGWIVKKGKQDDAVTSQHRWCGCENILTLWSGPYKDRDIAQGNKGSKGITRSRMSRDGLTESRAAVRVDMSGRCFSKGMLCQ